MDQMQSILKGRLRRNEPLKPFTTFYLGGPAEVFLEVRNEAELVAAVALARSEGLPYFLLGGGSNLVVSDRGVPGLVILNKAGDPDNVDLARGLITVSSGRPLSHLVGLAWRHCLTGLEPFTGIPGSVGGAVYGNAGAYGRSISDLLICADILTPEGELIRVDRDWFGFAYRTSALKRRRDIVVNVTVRVQAGEREQIKARMIDISTQRHAKHPPREIGSAGSFFKNLDPSPGETRRRAAGEVLEKAGAKQMSFGGASVYAKHANFIINQGRASAADVRELAQRLKEKVRSMFDIALEEEVIYLGA